MFSPGATELSDLHEFLARRVIERNIRARDDFSEVYAERFNLVVMVNVALGIQCRSTRVAWRTAPLHDRNREHGDHQHDNKPDHNRDFVQCVPRLHRVHHRSVSALLSSRAVLRTEPHHVDYQGARLDKRPHTEKSLIDPEPAGSGGNSA
jgi:hypothetical protein